MESEQACDMHSWNAVFLDRLNSDFESFSSFGELIKSDYQLLELFSPHFVLWKNNLPPKDPKRLVLYELYLELDDVNVDEQQLGEYVKLAVDTDRIDNDFVRCVGQFISSGVDLEIALHVLRDQLEDSQLALVVSRLRMFWFNIDIKPLVGKELFADAVEMWRLRERSRIVANLLVLFDSRFEKFKASLYFSLGDGTAESVVCDISWCRNEQHTQNIVSEGILSQDEVGLVREVANLLEAESESLTVDQGRALLSNLLSNDYFGDVVFRDWRMTASSSK
jgi:hypothetical protein